jgi:hypothetical protein
VELEKLPEVRLECLDEKSAMEVIRLCEEVPEKRRGKNSVRREGNIVVITYNNKMWPYDIADMAGELELAGDAEAAQVFACI